MIVILYLESGLVKFMKIQSGYGSFFSLTHKNHIPRKSKHYVFQVTTSLAFQSIFKAN